VLEAAMGKVMKRWAKMRKNQPPVLWRPTILLWVSTEYLMFRFVAGAAF
jgi:hypothetical protein